MKTFKRITAALSALTIMSAVSTAVPAFAEEATDGYEVISVSEYDIETGETLTGSDFGIAPYAASSGKIICDIVYNPNAVANEKYRVDVKFEGVPKIKGAGFHVNVGSGWNISTNSNGNMIRRFSDNVEKHADSTTQGRNGNILFFTFAGVAVPADYNGVVVSFYLTKKSGNTPTNSAITVSLLPGDYITDSNDENISTAVSTPVMLEANQYIIGDANGDGYVNALDSSVILTVAKKTPSLNVYSIRKTYKNYFPKAASPSAPDADRNEVINATDADKIIDYYAAVATGKPYTGSIGKIDVYEIFN